MKLKLLLVAAISAVALSAVPAMASAAPIRECGNLGRVGSGVVIKNVTTRTTSCSYARSTARMWASYGFPNAIQGRERVTVRGCTTITDVRGTFGEYHHGRVLPAVIRFQAYGRACD